MAAHLLVPLLRVALYRVRVLFDWCLAIGELLIPATRVVHRNFHFLLRLSVSPFPQAEPHQCST